MNNWLPVVGFEGLYEVSDDGRVQSLPRTVAHARGPRKRVGKELSHLILKGGHHVVRLYRGKGAENRQVHHLVLEAFVGPRPPGMDGLHWDDDPDNNTLPNLRWDTASENMHDKVRNGRHHNAVKTHCKQGHEYTDANTYRPKTGGRMCKTCLRVRGKQHMRKVRAAAKL